MSHNIKHTEEKHKKHKNTMKNFLQVNRALAASKNFRLVNRALAAAKILQNIGGGTSRHKASIIAKQFSQYCVSQSEGAQGKNLDEKAQLSPSCPLLASSLRLTCPLQLRRIALIFAVLVMSMANVGVAWGDVTLTVSETSSMASSETFADGSVLYSIDSDGRNNTNNFKSADIVVDGSNKSGPALSNKRFAIKFPVAVSKVVIYGYNSSTRSLSKIYTSTRRYNG